jgi:O-antigen/teichoic acid export membrane protein
LALLLLLPAVVYQVGNLGIPLAYAYYGAQGPYQRAAFVGPLLTFAPIQAGVLALVHVAVIAIWIWPHSGLHAAALLTLPWTPALLMHDYGLAILQGQRRFMSFNLLRTLPALTNAIVAIVLILVPQHRVMAAVAMLVIAMTAVGAATLAFALRSSRDSMTQGANPSLRQLVTFGTKAMFGASYPVETFRLDQLVVGLFLTASDLGLYVVALSFVNLPRLISQSIGYIAFPHVAAERDIGKQRSAIWRFFWATTAITVLVALVLELFIGSLIPLFFGNQFAPAVPVSRVLLLAAVLLSARRILTEAMKGAGNPAAGSIAEFISFAALLPTFLLFTRSLHLAGVGVALTASAAISLAVLVLLNRAEIRRPPLALADLNTALNEEAQGPALG